MERMVYCMRSPVFTGCCTALVTPFEAGGAVDYAALDRLLEAQLTAGVDALCVCGTTGESATLSEEEHAAVIAHCVRRVDRRAKIIAGAGGNDTAAALARSLRAQDAGADALLHVTPYYNKCSQLGLIRHYEHIAEHTALPILLYNVPSRTGMSFTAETYRALSQHPRINGVKEASGNFSLLTRTLRLCPDDFYVWSGNDDQVVPMMALGARGVISAAANLIPRVMVTMSRFCLEGDFRSASQLQLEYARLIDALFCEVNPIPVKTALKLTGLGDGSMRLPLCEMDSKNEEVLRAALADRGLIT